VITAYRGTIRLNNYQWHDTLFLGPRLLTVLRFGGEGQRMQFNQAYDQPAGGIMIFTSLANFLTGTPSSFNFAVPGRMIRIAASGNLSTRLSCQTTIVGKPNLTLNLGLRYEFAQSPQKSNGENLQPPQHFRLCHGHWGPLVRQPALKDFAPRMAWLGIRSRMERTSVRFWVGIFYDQLLPTVLCIFGQPQSHHLRRARANKSPISECRARFQRERSVCG